MIADDDRTKRDVPGADISRATRAEGATRVHRAREGKQVVAASGWRIRENLAMGEHLYVEDLVVFEDARSRGYGAEMVKCVQARGLGFRLYRYYARLQRSTLRFAQVLLWQRFDVRAYLFVRPLKG
jgi:hypothetical protein